MQSVAYFGPLDSLVSLAEQLPLQFTCRLGVMAERAVDNLPVHLSLLGVNPGYCSRRKTVGDSANRLPGQLFGFSSLTRPAPHSAFAPLPSLEGISAGLVWNNVTPRPIQEFSSLP